MKLFFPILFYSFLLFFFSFCYKKIKLARNRYVFGEKNIIVKIISVNLEKNPQEILAEINLKENFKSLFNKKIEKIFLFNKKTVFIEEGCEKKELVFRIDSSSIKKGNLFLLGVNEPLQGIFYRDKFSIFSAKRIIKKLNEKR